MKLIALALTAMLLVGCSRIPDEAVIAVLAPGPERIPVFKCLQVEGKDPPAPLLAALNARGSHYVPFSTCKHQKYGYVAANGQRALVARVSNFKRASPWRATVQNSESTGFLGGSGWTVKLEYKDGKWVVVSEVMDWISLWPNNSFKPSPLRGLVQAPMTFARPRPQSGPA